MTESPEIARLLEVAEQISPRPQRSKLADLPDQSEYRQAAAVRRYEERRKKEIADMNAKNKSADPPTLPASGKANKDADRLFHITTSGLTFGSRVWTRGEEFSAQDAGDAEWLDMSAEEQIERWGVQHFAPGPAPEDLTPEPDELTARPQVQDDPWTKGIRQAWAEEAEAASKSKLVTRSRTISGPKL